MEEAWVPLLEGVLALLSGEEWAQHQEEEWALDCFQAVSAL